MTLLLTFSLLSCQYVNDLMNGSLTFNVMFTDNMGLNIDDPVKFKDQIIGKVTQVNKSDMNTVFVIKVDSEFKDKIHKEDAFTVAGAGGFLDFSGKKALIIDSAAISKTPINSGDNLKGMDGFGYGMWKTQQYGNEALKGLEQLSQSLAQPFQELSKSFENSLNTPEFKELKEKSNKLLQDMLSFTQSEKSSQPELLKEIDKQLQWLLDELDKQGQSGIGNQLKSFREKLGPV